MKHTKLISGIIGIILGVIIAFFIPAPVGLSHAGMVVLASLVTANIFWIFNVIPSFVTGLLMLSSWIILRAVDFPTAFNIFSSTTMWIIIGGLGLGAAATKSGLINRIALNIMKLFPANFSGQTLALFTAGTIISPMIPSAHPKTAMSTPLALGISESLGYKNKTKESSGIFLAAIWGILVMEASFLSATAQNYAFKGLLPQKAQATMSWGNWFLMMLPWTIVTLVFGFFLLKFLFAPKDDKPAHMPDASKFDLSDRWIFDRLNHTVSEVTRLFDEYQFGEAGREAYNFIWNDFCDWYIEISKVALNGDDEELKARKQENLIWILDQILRLLHPIMPFVTEKLWLSMPHEGKSIMVAEYPTTHKEFENKQADQDMAFLIETIKAVRNIRMEVNAPMSSQIDIMIQLDDEANKRVLDENADYVENFLHPKELTVASEVEAPKLAKTAVIPGAQIFVPLTELVNVDDELEKMEKEEKRLEDEVARCEKKLANKGFVDHAPEAVVNKEKEKKADYESQLAGVRERIQDLKESK